MTAGGLFLLAAELEKTWFDGVRIDDLRAEVPVGVGAQIAKVVFRGADDLSLGVEHLEFDADIEHLLVAVIGDDAADVAEAAFRGLFDLVAEELDVFTRLAWGGWWLGFRGGGGDGAGWGLTGLIVGGLGLFKVVAEGDDAGDGEDGEARGAEGEGQPGFPRGSGGRSAGGNDGLGNGVVEGNRQQRRAGAVRAVKDHPHRIGWKLDVVPAMDAVAKEERGFAHGSRSADASAGRATDACHNDGSAARARTRAPWPAGIIGGKRSRQKGRKGVFWTPDCMAGGGQHLADLRFLPMVPRAWTLRMYSGAKGTLQELGPR